MTDEDCPIVEKAREVGIELEEGEITEIAKRVRVGLMGMSPRKWREVFKTSYDQIERDFKVLRDKVSRFNQVAGSGSQFPGGLGNDLLRAWWENAIESMRDVEKFLLAIVQNLPEY